MECQHELGSGGKCKICGTFLRHDWTDGEIQSSAREGGDAEGVAVNHSEHGKSRPRKKNHAASVAEQGNGKPEAPTTSARRQTGKAKAATKSGKRRHRKAK